MISGLPEETVHALKYRFIVPKLALVTKGQNRTMLSSVYLNESEQAISKQSHQKFNQLVVDVKACITQHGKDSTIKRRRTVSERKEKKRKS